MTAGRAAAFHALQLARNVLAGARLALFLPLRAEAFRVSPSQFALLVAFNFAVWVGAAAVRTGFEGEFQISALIIYLANIALVLATALLVALAYRTPERLMLIAIALSASDPLFDLTALALVSSGVVEGHSALFYVGFVVWAWLAALRAAVVTGGWGAPRVFLAGLAVSVMTAVALFVIPEVEVWQLPEDEEDDVQALIDGRVVHDLRITFNRNGEP